MAENNTPQGIGLSAAQNAISAMMAPSQEDNATEVDAQVEEADQVDEAEMFDDAEGESHEAEANDLDDEDETYEDDDTSQDFDIMAAQVEVNGEEKTVEELKSGYLRQQDYTRKTQALSEEKKAFSEVEAAVLQERAQYAEALPMLAQQIQQSVEQEPDWDTLYDTDPALAAKAERQWRKQQSRSNSNCKQFTPSNSGCNNWSSKELPKCSPGSWKSRGRSCQTLFPNGETRKWRHKRPAKFVIFYCSQVFRKLTSTE